MSSLLLSQEEKPDSGGTNFVFGQNMEERVTVSCSNKRNAAGSREPNYMLLVYNGDYEHIFIV